MINCMQQIAFVIIPKVEGLGLVLLLLQKVK
jgi:hypothetical protein